LANRIDRGGAVAVFPHQIQCRIGQASLHVTHSWHIRSFPPVDRLVNYFVQVFLGPAGVAPIASAIRLGSFAAPESRPSVSLNSPRPRDKSSGPAPFHISSPDRTIRTRQ